MLLLSQAEPGWQWAQPPWLPCPSPVGLCGHVGCTGEAEHEEFGSSQKMAHSLLSRGSGSSPSTPTLSLPWQPADKLTPSQFAFSPLFPLPARSAVSGHGQQRAVASRHAAGQSGWALLDMGPAFWGLHLPPKGWRPNALQRAAGGDSHQRGCPQGKSTLMTRRPSASAGHVHTPGLEAASAAAADGPAGHDPPGPQALIPSFRGPSVHLFPLSHTGWGAFLSRALPFGLSQDSGPPGARACCHPHSVSCSLRWGHSSLNSPAFLF